MFYKKQVIKDLLLIGGGHSHIKVIKSFGMNPIPGVRLTLINPDMYSLYSGMLPGIISGHYSFDDAHIDLIKLTSYSNCRFIKGKVIGIQSDNNRVIIEGRPPLTYDLLSINSGSSSNYKEIEDIDSIAIPVKPINSFLSQWKYIKSKINNSKKDRNIAVIGGGAGGVEIITAMRHSLGEKNNLTLITKENKILSGFPKKTINYFEDHLKKNSIELIKNIEVIKITKGKVISKKEEEFLFDDIFLVAQTAGPQWLKESNLDLNDEGFLLVNNKLQSLTKENIFGSGDIIKFDKYNLKKAGVYAVRQGDTLNKNIRNFFKKRNLNKYKPQKNFLSIITMGGKNAVVSKYSLSFKGKWVWHWKNYIDKNFISKFTNLSLIEMKSDEKIPKIFHTEEVKKLNDDMRCGGCGAKAAKEILNSALDGLNIKKRNDVVIGLDNPDDASIIKTPKGKLSTISLDFFPPMISDPYLFGKITAHHCLSDLYAMGAEPQSAMAIACLPLWPEHKISEELKSMLLGSIEIFNEENTQLVGGHTSEANECIYGFSVTGLIDKDEILAKSKLKKGDILVLTKAIGTGTILAANMRAKAKGLWVDKAIESMLISNKKSVEIIKKYGGTACTDITGFGLIGHLLEMLEKNQLTANINLENIPILDGADETISKKIISTLQDKNEKFSRYIKNCSKFNKSPNYKLLFDPQTAGGMLAGIPKDHVEDCLNDLTKNNYINARKIGTVEEQTKVKEKICIIK
ncbi:MAG: selenide, water dikinase SelD [Gammaproteobacteria bacterium]|nr:selenide, water dikinase SelD [Gammaproteobacteria bacterium]